MRMARGRCAIGAVGLATVLAASLALAGCVTTDTQTISPTAAEGASIIIESIDGPPRPISARLAKSLDQEAQARKLVVMTRGGQALYHLRAYLAAHSEGGTTALAWALDVFDAERKRAFRLRGEERGSAGGWNAADDATLQRIAAASIAQLVTFIASDRTGTGATAAAPSRGPTEGATQGPIFAGSRPGAAGTPPVLAHSLSTEQP
jgi:hypothetical protein